MPLHLAEPLPKGAEVLPEGADVHCLRIVKQGVVTGEPAAEPDAARVIVDLPYAASFEFGTQVRKRKGRRGSTGAAPAKPTLVPAARRARVTMRETLIELVKRQGLGVRDA